MRDRQKHIDWVLRKNQRMTAAGICRICREPLTGQALCIDCRIRTSLLERVRHTQLRLKAMLGYGACCACCGENEYTFLQFDHVDGDGAEHRKTVTVKALPRWIIRNEWPDCIQILCANCNFSKRMNHGACVHGN